MSYPFGQKPPQWSIDSGVVAYNASRLGLPMPVGLWAMWEKGGDKIYDLSGNGNTGSFVNDPEWIADNIDLDGGNDYIEIPYSAILEPDHISVVVRFRSDRAVQHESIIRRGDNSYNDSYTIIRGYPNIGDVRWLVHIAGSWYGGSTAISTGVWYTLIGTYDGSVVRMYIDGLLVGTPVAQAGVVGKGNITLNFGCRNNHGTTPDRYLDGALKIVQIYDYALSPNQVAAVSANPYGLIADPYQIETLAYMAAGGEEHVKNLSDTINLSDARGFMFGLNRSDLMSLSDSQIKNIGRPTTDTISISDGIAKNIGWSESDSITMSDGIAKTPGLPKADTITLSDNASMVASFLRSLNDTINLSDGVVKSYGTTKADIVTMSDSVAKLFGLSINDVTSLSEIIVKQIGTPKADSITLSDDITKNFGVTKSDTITLLDNLVSIIITLILNLNDTINLSDDIVKNVGTARADTINISDNFSKVIAYLRSFADTITLSDSMTKEPRLSKVDTITLSDSIAKELGLSREDTIILSDFFSSDAGIVWTNIIIKGIDVMSGEPIFITGRYRLP